ncbi:hypothetical protein BGK56_20970 (plasmid) [Providencia stuartii]|nr:hypothetical protein BGK56_20970 [Providencia stuartii]
MARPPASTMTAAVRWTHFDAPNRARCLPRNWKGAVFPIARITQVIANRRMAVAGYSKTHHRDKERHKWQVHAGGFIHECVKTHKHGRHHHIEQQGGDKHVA